MQVVQVQVGQDLALVGDGQAQVGLDLPGPARLVNDLFRSRLVADFYDEALFHAHGTGLSKERPFQRVTVPKEHGLGGEANGL